MGRGTRNEPGEPCDVRESRFPCSIIPWDDFEGGKHRDKPGEPCDGRGNYFPCRSTPSNNIDGGKHWGGRHDGPTHPINPGPVT